MSINDLNALEPLAFTDAFGAVFEHSSWVAAAVAHQRPFSSVPQLHAAMCKAMRAAPKVRQLELINAHPELAARIGMTSDSVAEQRGAGLESLTPAEHAALLELNRAYHARFGFPFVLAVKGKDKNDIRAALEARVGNDLETEFETALGEIEKIARFRLAVLISS